MIKVHRQVYTIYKRNLRKLQYHVNVEADIVNRYCINKTVGLSTETVVM